MVQVRPMAASTESSRIRMASGARQRLDVSFFIKRTSHLGYGFAGA